MINCIKRLKLTTFLCTVHPINCREKDWFSFFKKDKMKPYQTSAWHFPLKLVTWRHYLQQVFVKEAKGMTFVEKQHIWKPDLWQQKPPNICMFYQIFIFFSLFFLRLGTVRTSPSPRIEYRRNESNTTKISFLLG